MIPPFGWALQAPGRGSWEDPAIPIRWSEARSPNPDRQRTAPDSPAASHFTKRGDSLAPCLHQRPVDEGDGGEGDDKSGVTDGSLERRSGRPSTPVAERLAVGLQPEAVVGTVSRPNSEILPDVLQGPGRKPDGTLPVPLGADREYPGDALESGDRGFEHLPEAQSGRQ